MKVVQVVRQFAPAVGGVERSVLGLSRALRDVGIEVEVLTLAERFDVRQRLPSSGVVAGVPVTRVPRRGPRRYPWAPALTRHLGRFDLVHVHAHDALLDWVALTKRKSQPLIFNTHGGFFHTRWGQPLKHLFFQTVSRLALRRVATVIADSESDARRYRQICPRVEVIPNGIEYAHWSGLPRRPERGHLVFIGRLHSNKRLDRLVTAVAAAVRRGARLRLTIVGPDWGARRPLLQRISTLDLQDHVELRGALSDRQLDDVVSTAQATVLASDYEGLGMGILEGMAAGLIPVVQDLPVLRETVPPEAGFHCDFDDAAGAGATLAEVAALPDGRWQAMAAAARLAARRYAWDGIASRILAVYQRALA